MASRRVVVTGVGLATPIGHSLDAVSEALRAGAHGIVRVPEWDAVSQLDTGLAGAVRDLPLDHRWPRQVTRSMGRVSKLAAHATEQAVADAGLTAELLRSGRVGLAHGSAHSSSSELEAFCRKLFVDGGFDAISPSTFLRFMGHSCAANLALLHGVRGRVVPISAACVSGSVAIGAGLDAVRSGAQDVMLCGGAEELHYVAAGVFDTFNATSRRYNDAPDESPRPFDVERDGLVVAEGAGTLVLEEAEHARQRGARVRAEMLGYGTTCDGSHATSPCVDGMARCMALALEDAGLVSTQVQYVNAHATGTRVGDVAESDATLRVLGGSVAVSSTKGHTGHTLGACGAIEAALCIAMLRDGFVPPTRNLREPDPECAPLAYVRDTPRDARLDLVMSNNFAFGGINTSLVLGKPR